MPTKRRPPRRRRPLPPSGGAPRPRRPRPPRGGKCPAVSFRPHADEVLREQRDDVDALLRYVLDHPPGSPEAEAAREAAEAAYLRLARSLKRKAYLAPPALAAELERQANELYYRATLAAHIERLRPALVEAHRIRNLPPFELGPPPPGPLGASPGPPQTVVATPLDGAALVTWAPPLLPLPAVDSYTVTTLGPGAPPPQTGITTLSTTVGGLTNGSTYTVEVRAVNDAGASDPASDSVTINPPVVGAGPFTPTLPPLSSDPALVLDPLADLARQLVAAAGRTGAKWRYEHLKVQAVRAANDALQYETHIAALMAMAVAKATTAELLLNPVLIEASSRLADFASGLAELGASPQVDEVLEPLASAGAEAMMLPLLLAFLAEHGPIGFWIGFFEAIICDLAASFPPPFGHATDFGRTKRYLADVFGNSTAGSIGAEIRRMAQELLDGLDLEMERMIAPLKAAIAQVIQGIREAMAQVFESFDLPLTMTPSPTPGEPDIPNVDPLADLLVQLENEVQKVGDEIAARLRPLLQGVLGGDPSLFQKIAITYLAIPILAFLVISLAGGPFSAALLAAAVLIAAQELIRLLLRWLGGPLLRKLEEVRRDFRELVDRLQRIFAVQAAIIRNQSPAPLLRMLASELRELRNLVPGAFLQDAAAVLEEARNVVLRSALELGLAAEQALGFENGTAFDALAHGYESNLTPAPQLPGGTDPSRLAAAALLRDLGRLEQQRTAVEDGKELEFTHRLSLAKLLGTAFGAAGSGFVARREAVVELTEADLLDRTVPGVYRALIKEVRAFGLFSAVPLPGTAGIPLSITHLGPSRTRIKRSANPAAPPITLPNCFALTREQFVAALFGTPEDLFAALVAEVGRALEGARFPGFIDIFKGTFHDEVLSIQRTVSQKLPDRLAQAVERLLCGAVDPAPVRAAAVEALRRVNWQAAVLAAFPFLTFFLPRHVANVILPDVTAAALAAYDRALAELERRIGKWGGAFLEEDPDPNVRALGFARLVRPEEPETAIFHLFPAGLPAARAEVAPTSSDGPPLSPASVLQYRPFENRGIDGRLLVRLEPLTPLGAAGALLASLTDVVLEVTLRGCYDEKLAATLRAGQRRVAADLALVGSLGPPGFQVLLPGLVPRTDAGTGEQRTIHLSLRAHRDQTLLAWTAAVGAGLADPSLIAGRSPLGRDDPFRPLVTDMPSFTVAFDDAPPPANLGGLTGLATRLGVSRQILGVNPSLPAGAGTLAVPALVSLGVAVIPMAGGVRPADEPNTDPLGITLQTSSVLAPLLPASAGPGAPPLPALPRRLLLTEDVAAAVPVADLFDDGAEIAVGFGTGTFPPAADPLLYDVIVSLTYRAPVLEAATRLGGLG